MVVGVETLRSRSRRRGRRKRLMTDGKGKWDFVRAR